MALSICKAVALINLFSAATSIIIGTQKRNETDKVELAVLFEFSQYYNRSTKAAYLNASSQLFDALYSNKQTNDVKLAISSSVLCYGNSLANIITTSPFEYHRNASALRVLLEMCEHKFTGKSNRLAGSAYQKAFDHISSLSSHSSFVFLFIDGMSIEYDDDRVRNGSNFDSHLPSSSTTSIYVIEAIFTENSNKCANNLCYSLIGDYNSKYLARNCATHCMEDGGEGLVESQCRCQSDVMQIYIERLLGNGTSCAFNSSAASINALSAKVIADHSDDNGIAPQTRQSVVMATTDVNSCALNCYSPIAAVFVIIIFILI